MCARQIASTVRERGGLARRLLTAASWLTTPLQPEDFLGLINPMWSGGLRGRVEEVHRETADATTLLIRPGRGWTEHRAGQFVRIGVDVEGARRWRNYSLSAPWRGDGCLAITVKADPHGLVSSRLVHRTRPGAAMELSGPFGAFMLPEILPARLLFLTAGSGITPVMAMLRALTAAPTLPDTVVVHSAPTADRVIFGPELRALSREHPRLRLYEHHTRGPGALGRLHAPDLPRLCPDWSTRQAWACGPGALLDDMQRFWGRAGRAHQLRVERFHVEHRYAGTGGRVRFTRSDRQVDTAGDIPLSEVAERAGVPVPAGCRAGICGSCVAPLRAGRVRDLHTGLEHAAEHQLIRTCVSAAMGAVDIDL